MDPWELAQKRAEERNLEHSKRLKTPAMYALEVYLGVFTLEGLDTDNFDDDIRVRFKLLDFACVEVKRYVEEETSGSPSRSTSPSSPSSPNSSSPGSPASPKRTDTEASEADPKAPETKIQDNSKEDRKAEVKKEASKTESKKDASKTELNKESPKTENSDASKTEMKSEEPQSTEESTVGEMEPSISSKRRAEERIKRDPRYFDPKKLLRPKTTSQNLNEFGGEDASEVIPKPDVSEIKKRPSEATQPTSSVLTPSAGAPSSSENSRHVGASDVPESQSSVPDGVSEPVGSSQGPGSSQGVDSSPTGTESPSAFPTPSATEDGMEEVDDKVTEENLLSAISFENGKSIIFCKEPLNLLSSLPRYPLVVIFFRKPSEVLGIAHVPLSALAEAVDKSIVLTRSIPLSGVIRDTFDIFSKGRKVGMMTIDVRLSCFGPFLFHKIYVRDNPNDKSVHNMPVRKTSSQRLIVVEMSTANLGVIRHKSKIFISKSNPTLIGRVQRDISNLPPIVCADENVLDPPSKPKPEETSIVEEEERRREEARLATLSQFPQYKCIDDWEVIFTRNVIRDLIAKNRRPFQEGSADRKYVEAYFPELLPEKKGPKRLGAPAKSKKATCNCTQRKTQEHSDHYSLPFLPLDMAWLGENHIERIRRKSLKPQVTTSFSKSNQQPTNAISGLSMFKIPEHSDKSMSHVAVAHFNMEKGSYSEEDSRVVGRRTSVSSGAGDSVVPSNLKATSHTAGFNSDTPQRAGANSKKQSVVDDTLIRNSGRVFNTKHPRVNSSVERYNPLPEHPYMVELLAPERYPIDKLVEAIRVIGKEVEEIGGDTKMLLDTCRASEELQLEHIKKTVRSNLSPEASNSADPDGYTGKSVLIEVERGVPMAIHARSTPYWAGHAPVCDDPANCKHFLLLHPGFGFYGR